MSNSFPDRKKTTEFEATETRFNERDHMGESLGVTELHSAERTPPSRSRSSNRADKEPASNARVRAGGHPCRKTLRGRAWSLLGHPERFSGLASTSSPDVRSTGVLKR